MNNFVAGNRFVSKLIAVAFLLATPVALADINPKWLEKKNWAKAETDNFLIISDEGEKTAAELAHKLEIFRLTFQFLSGNRVSNQLRKIKVISVRNRRTFKSISAAIGRSDQAVAFFVDSESGNYSIVKASRTDSKDTEIQTSISRLFHEYTHYIANNLSYKALPYWYSEGFADFLSSVKVSDGNHVTFGKPVKYHLRAIDVMEWTSIEKIMKASRSADLNESEQYKIYSQGWLMTHYCLLDKQRNAQLREYIKRIQNGETVNHAFAASFEMSFKEMNTALRKHARKRRHSFKGMTLDSSKTPKIEASQLNPQDALFELGEYLLNGSHTKGYEAAKALFDRAIELDPKHANTLAGLANLYMFDDLDKASQYIERALQNEPDNPWVLTISGHINQNKMKAAQGKQESDKYWNLAARDYNRAINSGEINVEAIAAASRLYLSKGNLDKAIELLEAALSFAPGVNSLQYDLIQLYLSNGNDASAEKLIASFRQANHLSASGLEEFETWLKKVRSEQNKVTVISG